jgi:carbon storage regulator
MLVLSRKMNETIVIDNEILVTVVEMRGDKVRLGIVAPRDVPVFRQELVPPPDPAQRAKADATRPLFAVAEAPFLSEEEVQRYAEGAARLLTE